MKRRPSIWAYDCASLPGGMAGFTIPGRLTAFHQAIPLASSGFARVVPAIPGGLVRGIAWKLCGLRSVGNQPVARAG